MKDEKLRKTWKQDAEGVKHDILSVAMHEFAEFGLAGARIDEIAEKTKTSKRMIYYYFGDKEGLYIASIEAAYALARDGMDAIDIEGLAPDAAVREIAGYMFDFYRANPELVRMVMNENMHHAQFVQKSAYISDMVMSVVDRLQRAVRRGQDQGVFRSDVDPLLLFWQIQAQSFYNVSNQPSFAAKFGASVFTEDGQHAMRTAIIESVLRYLKA